MGNWKLRPWTDGKHVGPKFTRKWGILAKIAGWFKKGEGEKNGSKACNNHDSRDKNEA